VQAEYQIQFKGHCWARFLSFLFLYYNT